jgi:hypothetical protein
MADENEDQPDTGDEDKPDKGDASSAEVEKWKRMARKHEGRAKQAVADLEKAKADATSANQSDMDKLRQTVEALTKDLAQERHNAMVAEVAAARGLTPAQAKRLTGSSREEIEADADEIVEAFGIKPDKGKDEPDKGDGAGKGDAKGDRSKGIGRPKETLRPGAAQEDAEEEIDRKKAEELAKSIESGGFL